MPKSPEGDRRTAIRPMFAILVFAGVIVPAVAGDWPAFLGPTGDGTATEIGLAKVWPVGGPPVVWSKPVGSGYSAPSVVGDRVVLHHRVADREVVECFDAGTGESRWTHAYATDFTDPYGYNGGPRATPALTASRCYAYGAGGVLTCLNLTEGKPLWRRDVATDFDLPASFFGIGCSPVLHQKLVICLVGGQPDAAVVAFDADTGKTRWHAGGKPTWDGADTGGGPYRWTGDEQLISYATPTLATIHGKTHLFCLLRQGLLSLDPATGAERFHYWYRAKVHESVNAARPVVFAFPGGARDKVLLTAAYRVGTAVLRVTPEGGFEEVLRRPDLLECHWSTPIVRDGFAYGFSGRHESEGTLRCVDLAAGKVLWSVDGSEAVAGTLARDSRGGGYVDAQTGAAVPWPYFGRGSLTFSDGRFFVLGERGTLALANLSPTGYREISRTAVPGLGVPSWTAPVLANGRLYLRDEDRLIALDVSGE